MESIKGLVPFIKQAGDLAAERQRSVSRSYKEDGSVLTQVDRDLDTFLHDSVVSLFPEANVVTEEHVRAVDDDSEFTFAIDPIDGTDCYSQGMPGWCISIGLLDREFRPIAGIVYAPKWGADLGEGTLLFADIGKEALLNGEPIGPIAFHRTGIALMQVMVGSSLHQRFDMHDFKGKLRNAGSTVMHIVAPLLHVGVVGTILSPNYIWDILGAHAVIKSKGLTLEYYGGRAIDYRKLARREQAEEVVVGGTQEGIAFIRANFHPIKRESR